MCQVYLTRSACEVKLSESMNIETLRHISKFRGLTQSEIARAAQVSRQAVNQWFKQGDSFVPITSKHLLNLCRGTGISADVLINEIADRQWWENETTNLLWDGLYDDLVSFLIALNEGDSRALARLVEVYGLFASTKIIGDSAWKEFPNYKSYLPPIRRSELEQLWETQKSLHLL